MNILIDCYELIKGYGKSLGIYNYTRDLLKFLVPKLTEKYNVIIICNESNARDFTYSNCKMAILNPIPYDSKNKVLWEFHKVNNYIRKFNVDLYYSPRGFTPLLKECKLCTTIHDLIPFYYKYNYRDQIKKLENLYITKRLKQSALKADKIITISEFSKKQIIDQFQVSEEKISVIYNGMNDNKYYRDVKIEEEYIFAISSILAHKNLTGILKGYEEYCKINEKPLKLKVCGVKDYARYKGKISIETWKNVEFLKYLSDEELNGYYKNAKCFLFLSKIEGFGFPPLEAMKFQTPVICSDIECLREVVGNAALLVDPDNYFEIGKNINKLVNDSNTANYLISQGNKKYIEYGWEKCAEEVAKVFEQIL